MKKFLLPGILAAIFLFLPSRSQALTLDIPTGGYRQSILSPSSSSSTYVTLGYFVGKSTFSVALSTPPTGYGYCINHVVVTAPSAGLFEMWYSTSVITSGTTDYMVQTAASTPYIEQWPRNNAYCAPVNDELNLYLGVAGSTMTFEGFTFKGWNP